MKLHGREIRLAWLSMLLMFTPSGRCAAELRTIRFGQTPGEHSGRAVQGKGVFFASHAFSRVVCSSRGVWVSDGVADSLILSRPPDASPAYAVAAAIVRGLRGDAYDAILIADPGVGNARGRVQVYFGGPLDEVPDMAFEGESPGSLFGASVAYAGDTNHDGFGDFLVGAPGSSAGTGQAYLYFGSASGGILAAVLNGEATSDLFGADVCGIGRFNSDHFSDFAVGSPGAEGGHGQVAVFLGGVQPPMNPTTTLAPTSTGSYAERLRFGATLAAGDLNGDGFDDLAVGAPGWNGERGQVSAFLGGLTLPSMPYLSIAGEETFEHLGAALAIDSLRISDNADLVVGRPGASSGRGRISVLFGGSAMGDTPDLDQDGVSVDDRFGSAVGGLPDFVGNEGGRVLIGAPLHDGLAANAGAAYSLSVGAPLRITSTTPPRGWLSFNPYGISFTVDLNWPIAQDSLSPDWVFIHGSEYGTIFVNSVEPTEAPNRFRVNANGVRIGELLHFGLTTHVVSAAGVHLARPYVWRSRVTTFPPSALDYAPVQVSIPVPSPSYAFVGATPTAQMALAVSGADSLLLLNFDGNRMIQSGSVATGDSSVAVTLLDLDHSGSLELATADYRDGTLSLYSGLTLQRQSTPVGTGPNQILVSDFNGDGWSDLLVGLTEVPTGTAGYTVLLGGQGQLQPAGTYGVLGTLARFQALDLDNDGDIDVAASTVSPPMLHLLRNRGDGQFTYADTLAAPNGTQFGAMVAGDLDDDHWEDLLVLGTGSANEVLYYRNLGGSFALDRRFAIWSPGRSICVGPLRGGMPDANPSLDIAVGTEDGWIRVLVDPLSAEALQLTFDVTSLDPAPVCDVVLSALNFDQALDIIACTTTGEITALLSHYATDTTAEDVSLVAPRLEVRPNPFRGSVQFRITAINPGAVRADILDVQGRRIRTFGPVPVSGRSRLELLWDGRTQRGGRASHGVYILLVTTPDTTWQRKITLLR